MLTARVAMDFATRGRTYSYGEHPSQVADLRLPAGGGPHRVAILIHGGSWQQRYGRVVMRALAGDLVRRGWASWNIEYRRVGGGGGWPHTFADVAAAIDLLGELDAPLSLDGVCVIGHSAGGHLALWAASRANLPPGSPGSQGTGAVNIASAISQAGVADLALAWRMWRGGAAQALMGGGPDQVPDRYAAGDPVALLPAAAPVLLVHGVEDATVSLELSQSYERAALAAGARVDLVQIAGRAGAHRAHIDPRGEAWRAVTERLG